MLAKTKKGIVIDVSQLETGKTEHSYMYEYKIYFQKGIFDNIKFFICYKESQ